MNGEASRKADVSATLANHVIHTTYEDIPPEVVAVTKRTILDILSVAVAGTTAYSSNLLVDLIKGWGGKEESTILCYDTKVPAMHAAMANATMGRALDYMDRYDPVETLVGVTIVPAAFAIAEKRGMVSGKDFIAAVTLGLDIIPRMALATKGNLKGWSGQAVFGYFGVAATGGKLLGLSEKQIVDAFGIAYSQAAGNHQSMKDGALSKRLSTGFAAKGGILAALLAEKGFSGGANSMEGPWGFYNLYIDGDYDPSQLTIELGKRFEGANISVKAYPCCSHTHTGIDATLDIISRHDIVPEQVGAVKAGVNARGYDLSCDPIERKRKPITIVDAQFNLPYAIATAIVDREVNINNFTEKMITRRQVLKMMQKIEPYVDNELENMTHGAISPCKLEIITTNGAVYQMQVSHSKGSPQNPMTQEELNRKVWDCMDYAAKSLSKDTVHKVIDLVNELEKIDDVAVIMKLLN